MVEEIVLTISDGESLSNEAVSCKNFEGAIALLLEAGFNTTAVSFVAYDAKDNAYNVFGTDFAEYTFTVSQAIGGYYPLDPLVFAGMEKFKLRRGTQASPYTTNDENTVIKILKRVY